MYWLVNFTIKHKPYSIHSNGEPLFKQYKDLDDSVRFDTWLGRKITFRFNHIDRHIWELTNYYPGRTQSYEITYESNDKRIISICTRFADGTEKKWTWESRIYFRIRLPRGYYLEAEYTKYGQLSYISSNIQSGRTEYTVYSHRIVASVRTPGLLLRRISVKIMRPIDFIPTIDKLFPDDLLIKSYKCPPIKLYK